MIQTTVLFVVATIVLFLGLDWLIQRRKKTPELAVAAPEPAPVRLPAGVFFSPSHTWVNLFPSGRAWLGVDDIDIASYGKEVLKLRSVDGSQKIVKK